MNWPLYCSLKWRLMEAAQTWHIHCHLPMSTERFRERSVQREEQEGHRTITFLQFTLLLFTQCLQGFRDRGDIDLPLCNADMCRPGWEMANRHTWKTQLCKRRIPTWTGFYERIKIFELSYSQAWFNISVNVMLHCRCDLKKNLFIT